MSSMQQYRRKPALIILVVALTLGVGYVMAWGKVERYLKKKNGDHSIEAIEQKIAAGDHSAGTWAAYAEALSKAGQHHKAADAYKQVLVLEPFKREMKFQYGLSLALAGRGDEFYAFQKDLVYSEAKLAVELLERPEAGKFMGEARFAALKEEARSQAMD